MINIGELFIRLVVVFVCLSFITIAGAYAAPQCQQMSLDEDPPVTVRFGFWENDIGLRSVTILESQNVTAMEPFFSPGTTSIIQIEAEQINTSECVSVAFEAEDMTGATSQCGYTNCVIPDLTPPDFTVIDSDPGPPATVSIAIQDTESGLSNLASDNIVNATVNIPSFSAGSTNQFIVTAEQVSAAEDGSFSLSAQDVTGNVSLFVYNFSGSLPDTQPPSWSIRSIDLGPPVTVQIQIQDAQSGLQSITVTDTQNADVAIPSFAPGITSPPVVITVTQQLPAANMSIAFTLTDMAGNSTSGDYELLADDTTPPSWSIESIDPGPPASVTIQIEDTQSGLSLITMTDTQNADVTIPPFPVGVTSPPVEITATQISPSSNMTIAFTLEDMAGNTSSGDYLLLATDANPPICDQISFQTGPPASIMVSIQDTQSGLATIEATEADNAAFTIPAFEYGTVDPVVIEINQVEQNLPYDIRLRSVDARGNVAECVYPDNLPILKSPEFDAVGIDSVNFFVDVPQQRIAETVVDNSGALLNTFSDFPAEQFVTDAGIPIVDPCFSAAGSTYQSVYTPPWSNAAYEWRIVLQMEPASDIGLKIASCVIEAGESDPWMYATQTGLFRLPWSPDTFQVTPASAPTISARAFPGPQAHPGFPQQGFSLDVRRIPNLGLSPAIDVPLFFNGMQDSWLSLVLPASGAANASGETAWNLNPGDIIMITVDVPFNNTAGLRFGQDNVSLNYIGRLGTQLRGSN